MDSFGFLNEKTFVMVILLLLVLTTHLVLIKTNTGYKTNNVCTFLNRPFCQKIPFCEPFFVDTNPCKGEICPTVAYPQLYKECILKTSVTNNSESSINVNRQEDNSPNSKTSVIVTLDIPFEAEGYLSETQVETQRKLINKTQNELLSKITGEFSMYKIFTITPSVALKVDNEAMEYLSSSPLVKDIQEDKADPLN